MVWLSVIVCLAIGILIGFTIAGRSKSSPSKVHDLEVQLEELRNNHNNYREEVSNHFSTTAELVQHMTDSYRDVYQHLATGAQELCSGEVASKLLPTSSDSVPGSQTDSSNQIEDDSDSSSTEDSVTATETDSVTDSDTDSFSDIDTNITADTTADSDSNNDSTPDSDNVTEPDSAANSSMEAPKDYAPRTSPDHKGALSEDFGLDKTPEPEKKPL